jgi:hypothetical protein
MRKRAKTVIWGFFVLGCSMSIGASIAELVIVGSNRRALDREVAGLERNIADVKSGRKGLSQETVAALDTRLAEVRRSKEQVELLATVLASIEAAGSVLMLLSVVAIATLRRSSRQCQIEHQY